MATSLQPSQLGGRTTGGVDPHVPAVHRAAAARDGGVARRAGRVGRPRRTARERILASSPTWPITALLAGYPLWWALGLGEYVIIVLAIPMAVRMAAWRLHRDRTVRVPPGFGLWLLFLVCMLAGAAALTINPAGTIASPVSNRMISYAIRAASYLSVTVLLLYAGNLTERELPRRRLAGLLGLVAVYATVGGLAGVLFPNVTFTSPLALVVPERLQQINLVLQAMLHPRLAEVQNVLGTPHGRPNAPFVYTNEWGNSLALLLPWLLVSWWSHGTRRQRQMVVAVLAIVILPVIHSLDRGLWIGLIVAICFLVARLLRRGRFSLFRMLAATLVLVCVAVAVSPLGGLVSQRLTHGRSDASRASLSVAATKAALSSPLIGYGDTRHQQGSVQSIAIGRSDKCQQCGEVTIGGNGQLWMLLICTGFLGTALYLSFFAFGIWRYRRDPTAYGTAGVLVLLLGFVFMIAYTAVGAPLAFTMLGYALLWRNDRVMLPGGAPRQWARGPARYAARSTVAAGGPG